MEFGGNPKQVPHLTRSHQGEKPEEFFYVFVGGSPPFFTSPPKLGVYTFE